MKYILVVIITIFNISFCFCQKNSHFLIEGKGYYLNGKKFDGYASFSEIVKFDTNYLKSYICGDTLIQEITNASGTIIQNIQIKNRYFIYNAIEDHFFGLNILEHPHSPILKTKVEKLENSKFDFSITSSEYKKYTSLIKVDSLVDFPVHWSTYGKEFSNIFTEFGAIKELFRLPDSLVFLYSFTESDDKCIDKLFGDFNEEKIQLVEMPGLSPSKTTDVKSIKFPKNKLITKYNTKKSMIEYVEKSKEEIILIDFWASWCKPCIEEFKYLTELYNEIADIGVRFIGINIDKAKDFEKAQKIIETHKLQWDQLYDFEFTNEKWKGIDLNGIPRLLIINKKGKIIEYDAPRPSSDKLKNLLSELIK